MKIVMWHVMACQQDSRDHHNLKLDFSLFPVFILVPHISKTRWKIKTKCLHM